MNLGEFLSANTHAVEPTSSPCLIWDGDYSRGVPVFLVGSTSVPVRKYVYESLNGKQHSRSKYDSLCENPNCVHPEHIKLVKYEDVRTYPADKVAEAMKLYNEGLRQDIIASKMGVDPSTVSKYIKYGKEVAAGSNSED